MRFPNIVRMPWGRSPFCIKVVMSILNLVRNFVESHHIAIAGGWHIADCVRKAYDVEGMDVGTVGAGRIGLAVLRRMKPFDTKLHYFDQHRLPATWQKLAVVI